MSSREEIIQEFIGSVIASILMYSNLVILVFCDGRELHLEDEGQQCCEYRYFESDDDPTDAIGGQLISVKLKQETSSENNAWDVGYTDCAFVDIETTCGVFQIKAYNKHNGYYAGFDITARKAASR